MPRDPDSLEIRKFASGGLIENLTQSGITWLTGWTAIFERATNQGGQKPRMRTFNYLFRLLSGHAHEVNQHGLLEHSLQMDYVHPAFVVGTDNEIYRSKVSNGPASGNATDPTTDTTNAVWESYSDTIRLPITFSTSAPPAGVGTPGDLWFQEES